MKNFSFQNTTKIIFGTDAVSKISAELKGHGTKVMLTYGKNSIKESGLYDKVKAQLAGYTVLEFSGIEPNPRVETLREGVKLGKEFQPDIILAVGGGSVIDGSKLIAASIHNENEPWDLVLDRSKINKCVPIATVLTISATGTEMNRNSVITNWTEKLKLGWDHDNVLPVVSFLDPQNTYTVSAIQTAYGIVDIFSHVLEQYMTTAVDVPLQNRWAEGVLLTLIENAPIVLNNLQDYNSRANIMLCSTYALNGFFQVGANSDWATHDIEHELSAFYDIPHGLGLAILTSRWMRTVKDQKLAKLAHYGRRVFALTGDDATVADQAIQSTYDFFKSLGIKMELTDHGINDEHFAEITKRLVASKIGEFALTGPQISEILTNSLTK